MSAALAWRAADAFWPAHKGVKSVLWRDSAADRSNAMPAVANGKAGAWSHRGPNSRMTRLTMPLAGLPLNTLVKAVCCAAGDCKAARCKALVVASWLHK